VFKDSVDIESVFRQLNALSKILVLPHFSGHRNSFASEIKHESKFVNIIWCVAVICTILTGFVYSIITLNFAFYSSVFRIVLFVFSIPIGYLGTLLALIAGLTWNGKKFPEFVLKISIFDEHMFGAKRADVYKKQYKCCIMQLAALFLCMFPFYCYDVYLFATCITKNDRTFQTSPVESGKKGTDVLVSEFPVFINDV